MALGVARPRVSIFLSALLVVAFALGLPKLSINADTRVFFSDQNENRRAFDLFEARYDASVNLLIALHAEDGDVFTAERLAVLNRITEGAWRLPYATRVDSIANATHIRSDLDGIVIAETIPADSIENTETARQRVFEDPLLVNRLISADGKTTGINILVQYPMSSSAVTGEILSAAQSLIAEAGTAEVGLSAWYGGRVASSNAFSTASKMDMATLLPISLLAIFALLAFLLRSLSAAGALFFTATLAAVCALGFAGWTGMQINAATSQSPTIIIALCVAALAHLIFALRRHLYRGETRKVALTKSLATNAFPIALTLGTTSIGFLTLNVADAPPFRQLGSIVSVGAAMSLVLGFLLLPALLRFVQFRQMHAPAILSSVVQTACDLSVAKWKTLVVVMPVACIAAAAGIALIAIDDTFTDYFSDRFAFHRHAKLIEQNLTGLEVLEFDISGGQENAIYDAAYTAKLQRFEDWLQDQPKVTFTASILEIYKRLNRHLNGGGIEQHVVPADREALAQYILLYEMSLPLGMSLTNSITVDKSGSRVTAIMRDASTKEVRALREQAEEWLNADAPTAITGNGTGLAVMFAYLSSLNIKSMIGGTAAALVLISAILTFAFRSVRYGAISLIPNLLPGIVAFGVWGLLVGKVGVAVSVVGAMTLGIIVDDTVHLIWRYREARKRGESPEDAIRTMFSIVGEPMLVSTLVLIAGFGMLALSGFHITSSTGALASMIIAFALICDWLLLAPLLIATDTREETNVQSDATRPHLYLVANKDEIAVRDTDTDDVQKSA